MAQPVNGTGDLRTGQTSPLRSVKDGDFHNVSTAGDLGCGKSRSEGRLRGRAAATVWGNRTAAYIHTCGRTCGQRVAVSDLPDRTYRDRGTTARRGEPSVSDIDLAEVWTRSLDGLAGMGLQASQLAWLRLTRPLGLVENTALIATPNPFVKEYLETKLRPLVIHALSKELGRPIQIAVTVDPSPVTPPDHPQGPPSSPLSVMDSLPAPPADASGPRGAQPPDLGGRPAQPQYQQPQQQYPPQQQY